MGEWQHTLDTGPGIDYSKQKQQRQLDRIEAKLDALLDFKLPAPPITPVQWVVPTPHVAGYQGDAHE